MTVYYPGEEKLSHSLIEVNIWVIHWLRNPESYALYVGLYPAALLFHTPKQLSLVASWLQLFHNKLCGLKQSAVYSQQTLRTSVLYPRLWFRTLSSSHFYDRDIFIWGEGAHPIIDIYTWGGKCPLKSHWALFWETRIWFQSDVALLRRDSVRFLIF